MVCSVHKELFGTKARIVKGNLDNINSIKEFLQNQDAVYLNLSVKQSSSKNDFQPEREGLKNILSIAKETNIKRIGYLSSLLQFYKDSNCWALGLKKDAVNLIKASGINYSIFYPSTFMESFDKGAYRQGNNINLAGKSNYPMFLIAGSDYANQVVKAFEINNGNNEYIVQGLQGFIADDAANIFADNYTKADIKVIKLPFAVLKFFGMFTNKFNYATNIIDALNNYPENFEAEKTWEELGKPNISFIDYIRNA